MLRKDDIISQIMEMQYKFCETSVSPYETLDCYTVKKLQELHTYWKKESSLNKNYKYVRDEKGLFYAVFRR